MNVNGGAIAIGHPLGMSGARLVVSLLHELRRRGGRYGVATMCVGVGQGQAALFERRLDLAEPIIVRSMAVVTKREYGLFINGELVEPASGDVRDLTEPATGEPLARAAMAGTDDVERAVDAARAALAGPWGKTPPTERSRLLHALADAIVANRKELARARDRVTSARRSRR